MSDVDVLVIGAGVVGLAVADALASEGWSPLVVERHARVGQETSSRNSQVVHAGIYYPTGSLKARLCVRGRELLYAFCVEAGVEHRRLGKLVLAREQEEMPQLEALKQQGEANGVQGLRLLHRDELARLEPSVEAWGALLSVETGIVDAHGLMKGLQARARGQGAEVLCEAEVRQLEPTASGWRVEVAHLRGPQEAVTARWVVNAAGLCADEVAALAGVSSYHHHYCKGDYFRVPRQVASQIQRLIYPLPSAKLTGLGIHFTLDLAGGGLLGPDTTYVERGSGYDVDSAKAGAFACAAARMIPGLRGVELQPDFSGIRPKLQGSGESWQDFVIAQDLPGLVNLVGIESPGLTAALAIGEEVARMVGHDDSG
ncbi:MAG: NAD(P)/FAD-dependent oxidoreductase [Deltaproteobacteria bacterium]|nr:NAD(P)/FAD-dependent oxidoreductase [Deltaproteobacteria bacterium]